jgi:hypothetical protein
MITEFGEEGKTYHMCTNIAGFLRNFKRKKITFMEDDDGNPMSDREARESLQSMLASGDKYIQSTGCFNFDPQHGCPGHTKEEIRQHEIAKAKAKLAELEGAGE